MKVLVVEDDFISRKLMQRILFPYGDCDIAVNGKEAVEAFKLALEEGEPYDLVCLDIMMPIMDGQEVLRQIRELEKNKGIERFDGVKVIMTTALSDTRNVVEAMKSQCDAYLIKPIVKDKLVSELRMLGLV
ncbi:MAG: response regulator [Desulfobacterales bacterium]|nr:response regulator [Desulfobacterales bacterium]MBF0396866.1 response regulator [Desulfobacterales bacterium]